MTSADYKATLVEVTRRAAREFGDVDFIVMPDRRMTFGEIDAASRRMARQLVAAGVGKGTRVGLFYTYGPEFVVAWLAGLRVGALMMPFSTISKPAELRTLLRIGDVHLLLAPSTLLGRDVPAYLEEAIPGLAAGRLMPPSCRICAPCGSPAARIEGGRCRTPRRTRCPRVCWTRSRRRSSRPTSRR